MTRIIHLAGLLAFIVMYITGPALARAGQCPLPPLKGLDQSKVAVCITPINDQSNPVVSYNTLCPLIPASITKAVTSAAVLSLHGPDATFATRVVADGTLSPDGTLKGNIVVEVSGDPTLGSAHFADSTDFANAAVEAVAAAGITRILGDVTVDTGDRLDHPAPAGWMQSDLGHPYGTLHCQASYADNCFEVHLPSGRCTPPVPDLKVSRSSSGKGRLRVSKQRGGNTVKVHGRYPRGGVTVTMPNSSPERSLRADLRQRLKARGVAVDGKQMKPETGDRQLLYLHHSPRYADILTSTMHRSDNMFAEGMLRSLAPWGSRSDALDQELRILSQLGVVTADIFVEDGSGLSRDNRLTASFMEAMLRIMAIGPQGMQYAGLFPKAGIEGTVKRLLKLSPLAGRVLLKSGSMKGVRCFAGYLMSEGPSPRPTHTIVVMVNGYTGNSASLRAAIEDLLSSSLMNL